MAVSEALPTVLERIATISECERYRYTLERRWRARPHPTAVFYLCNPSTANAELDDHTTLKCIGFAERWGCGSLVIVNPCALRSRDPKVLTQVRATDAIGPDNAEAILYAASIARLTKGPFVAGWGLALPKVLRPAANAQMHAVDGVKLQCLGLTADGQPRHPLMLPYSTPLVPFEARS